MVGNDIIDLTWARKESDWRREGFLKKVFTQHEQLLIHSSDDPFATVWRLWSMKESAYKLFLQTGKNRFFNPRRLKCEIHSPFEGFVKIEELQIYTRSEYNHKFIFSSAFASCGNEPEDHIFPLPNTDTSFQTKFTYQQLLNFMSRKWTLIINRMDIRKTDQNVPELFYDGRRLNVSISLTHHGHYGAYSVHIE